MNTFWVGAGGAVGGVITAAGAYFGVRRTSSGGIKTSTAEDLWNESNKMREALSARLVAAEDRAESQAREIDVVRQEALHCQQKALRMEAQIAALEDQVRELRGMIS